MVVYYKSKYKNVKTEYKGRLFDSMREANHAAMLDGLRFATQPKDKVIRIEYQYPMPLIINGTKIAKYIADFYVVFEDGHHEIHEVKGFKTREYIIKKKLVEALYREKIMEF